MSKRNEVLLTQPNNDGSRTLLKRLPFTSELCETISQQLSSSSSAAMTPVEVAVALGTGKRLNIQRNGVVTYLLLDGPLHEALEPAGTVPSDEGPTTTTASNL